MDGETLERLEAHEKHSAARASILESELKRLEGIAMSTTDNVRDDVNVHNIFKGLGSGGAGGLGMGGLGAGVVGGLLGGLLFRRGGFGGDEGGGAETRIQDTVFNTSVLNKLGAIEAAIPFNEAQMQLALAGTQTALTAQATTNANASTLAISGVKDAVQSSALIAQQNAANILQAIANSTREVISKIDGNTIANLQAELAESRSGARAAATEVNVTQNVNQNQMQQQQQFQIQNTNTLLQQLLASHQSIQQGIVNLGNMSGNAGQQTAANTRVY